MNSKEDIRTISHFKAHADNILDQVAVTRRPVCINQNGKARAVLLDAKTYQNMQKALGILKILSFGEKDIRNKKLIPLDEVWKRIEKIVNV